MVAYIVMQNSEGKHKKQTLHWPIQTSEQETLKGKGQEIDHAPHSLTDNASPACIDNRQATRSHCSVSR